ncbi:MAG: hypothetical protein A3E83_09210 [Gammaproteobacteria bacterium RIFCSPHIGHO2_12_FULL_41_20]|nr:MAG: hypothetical protein A3E83_09210 [Gammaproteobacteria bacterium RIFCSPHIGHO2_12_FULL_41_20]
MRYIIALIAFLVLPLAYAVKVHDLYEAMIPVASQSSQDRMRAIPKALEQVLVKNSGNLDIAKDARIKSSLQHAENLLQEYSYQPSTVNLAFPYLLIIKFDHVGVSQLLKRADQPLWGSNRPLILVWLAVPVSAEDMEIIGVDSASTILSLFKQQAAQSGVPIIFPVMDMQDLNQISIQDIVTMSLPALTRASQRYAPDAVLVGHWVAMPQQGVQGLQSQWKFVQGGSEQDWTISGASPNAIIDILFNHINTTLTHRYVGQVAATNAQPIEMLVTVQVNGITHSRDLTVLLRALKQVTGVEDVQVIQVSNNAVWLEIDVHTALDNFLENVALIPHLVLESKRDETLVYTWDR